MQVLQNAYPITKLLYGKEGALKYDPDTDRSYTVSTRGQ